MTTLANFVHTLEHIVGAKRFHVRFDAMLHKLVKFTFFFKVKTAGLIASEITAGDERVILSLVWSIIHHFQVS